MMMFDWSKRNGILRISNSDIFFMGINEEWMYNMLYQTTHPKEAVVAIRAGNLIRIDAESIVGNTICRFRVSYYDRKGHIKDIIMEAMMKDMSKYQKSMFQWFINKFINK